MKKESMLKKLWLFCIAFVMCCFCGCKDAEIMEGKVIKKIYVPERVSTGTGISTSGKMVITTEVSSDKYIIFYEKDNEIEKLYVDAESYFKLKNGDYFRYWDKWHGNYFIKEDRKNGL